MAKIVQFMHPGKEHNYKKDDAVKQKNTGRHERNFICTDGSYVDLKGQLQESSLCFWGEWENEADIIRHYASEKDGEPKALISPIVPKLNPCNTDPFVFGDCFKYFWCQQRQNNAMKKLEKGDIVIFGSNLNGGFVFDTIFVVQESIPYNYPTDLSKIKKSLSKEDYELFYKSSISFDKYSCDEDGLCPCGKNRKSCSDKGCPDSDIDEENLERIFYKGATFDNPVNGMYSFVPVRLETDCKSEGFARPQFSRNNIISDGLTQNFKISEIENENPKAIWDELLETLKRSNCFRGVRFILK